MSRLNDLNNHESAGTPFPPSRLTCRDDARSYYAFCRAAPEDLLSSVTNALRPLVLLLGAGDGRSIFYTLYRNFDPEFRGRFEGANFLVNENWSVLQARDILMLYLCLQLPHKVESQEGRLLCAAIWAISFCHTLRPPHVEILKKALEVLTRFSTSREAWVSPDNPLGQIVKFATPQSFHDITRHWREWSSDQPKNAPTVEKMKQFRNTFLSSLHQVPLTDVMSTYPEQCIRQLLGLSADQISEKRRQKMQADLASFLELGSVFVEDILNLSGEEDTQTTANVTFFDGTTGAMHNNPFYGLVPYLRFFHSFLFSPNDCRSGSVARSLVDRLPVKDDKFDEHPLIANSVQQLVFWLAASSRALRKLTSQTSPDVTFTFECSDPISFCLQMLQDQDMYTSHLGCPPVFDVIHTFEMIDVLSPPDLLLNAAPLLKPSSYLLATTLLYRKVSFTLDRFMAYIFGVHPQIFPVMYGVRCLGVEGTFFDGTLPRHTPWSHLKREENDIKTLVFQRVTSSPLKFQGLEEIDYATKGLASATLAAIHSFPTNLYGNLMCMETVVTYLLTFIAQLDDTTPIDKWEFWEPYSQLVVKRMNLIPYHNHLQVIAMLHDLHLHIVVNDRDCPMCRYCPLSTYIAQFSVEIPDPKLSPHSTLALYIGKGDMKVETFATNVRSTHCINAVALRRDKDERYFVEFFYQRRFAEANYKLTVLKFVQTETGDGNIMNLPSIVYEGMLADGITEGSSYNFRPLPTRQRSLENVFGKMRSNVVHCDRIHIIVDLDAELVYKVDYKALIVDNDQLSNTHLRLRCSYCEYNIHFPFSVLFSEMRIEFHCKLNTATITAPRDIKAFYEEKPVFVVSPTNRLFLPAFPVNPASFSSSLPRDYIKLQINRMEGEALKTVPITMIPPTIKMKHMLRTLFQLMTQCRFVTMNVASKKESTTKMTGMLVVHDEVVDLDTRSPALDLSYCFLDEKADQSHLKSTWCKITADHTARALNIDSEYLVFAKKLFKYFGECTHTVYSENNRTSLCRVRVLKKHNLESDFKRAVVFPLYGCPDINYEERTVVREPMEEQRLVAGVFTQDVSENVKKVFEMLGPTSKPKQKMDITLTGTSLLTDRLGTNNTIAQLLQGLQARGMLSALAVSTVSTPVVTSGADERRRKARDGWRKTRETSEKTATARMRESRERAREKAKEKAREKARQANAKTASSESNPTPSVEKKEEKQQQPQPAKQKNCEETSREDQQTSRDTQQTVPTPTVPAQPTAPAQPHTSTATS